MLINESEYYKFLILSDLLSAPLSLCHIGIQHNQAVDTLANIHTYGPILKPSIIPFTDQHQEFKKTFFSYNKLTHDKSGQFKR